MQLEVRDEEARTQHPTVSASLATPSIRNQFGFGGFGYGMTSNPGLTLPPPAYNRRPSVPLPPPNSSSDFFPFVRYSLSQAQALDISAIAFPSAVHAADETFIPDQQFLSSAINRGHQVGELQVLNVPWGAIARCWDYERGCVWGAVSNQGEYDLKLTTPKKPMRIGRRAEQMKYQLHSTKHHLHTH